MLPLLQRSLHVVLNTASPIPGPRHGIVNKFAAIQPTPITLAEAAGFGRLGSSNESGCDFACAEVGKVLSCGWQYVDAYE